MNQTDDTAQKARRDGDEIVLSTGKRVSAYAGVVGIELLPKDPAAALMYCGYDDHVPSVFDDTYWSDPDDEDAAASILSAAECVELADLMIQRWAEFKEHAANA